MKSLSHPFPGMRCAVLANLLFLTACGDDKPGASINIPATGSPAVEDATTDRWLGQWNGPEGTWLRLEGGNGKYDVGIRNLDGERHFRGERVGDEIHFERDGKTESLRPTNGAGTGMKWLDDRRNCLTVSIGEGYCKD